MLLHRGGRNVKKEMEGHTPYLMHGALELTRAFVSLQRSFESPDFLSF
jgi:hypothetical protein